MRYEDLSEADRAYINLNLEDNFGWFLGLSTQEKIEDMGTDMDGEIETIGWFSVHTQDQEYVTNALDRIVRNADFLRIHLLPNA